MLDPKQYELIGRITIGFNEIDFLMAIYTNEFLCTREAEIAEVISNRERLFRQRKELFDGVLRALAARYLDLDKLIALVTESAEEAEKLSKERTSIVHGLLVFDIKSGRSALRFGKHHPPCDEAKLADLLNRLSSTEDGLASRCYDLLEALNAKRT